MKHKIIDHSDLELDLRRYLNLQYFTNILFYNSSNLNLDLKISLIIVQTYKDYLIIAVKEI